MNVQSIYRISLLMDIKLNNLVRGYGSNVFVLTPPMIIRALELLSWHALTRTELAVLVGSTPDAVGRWVRKQMRNPNVYLRPFVVGKRKCYFTGNKAQVITLNRLLDVNDCLSESLFESFRNNNQLPNQ